jgi:hypothetical protein
MAQNPPSAEYILGLIEVAPDTEREMLMRALERRTSLLQGFVVMPLAMLHHLLRMFDMILAAYKENADALLSMKERGSNPNIVARNTEAKRLKESTRKPWWHVVKRMMRENNKPEWWPNYGDTFRAIRDEKPVHIRDLKRIGNSLSKQVAKMKKAGND